MINFIKEYVKNPRQIGAIAPSTKYLANSMIHGIDFGSINCIVEYGPGTGVFTSEILKNCKVNTKVILLETNEEFCNELRKKYGELDNVEIINDSAENVNIHLKRLNVSKVDYVISGLPFASLPKDISSKILDTTNNLLSSSGEFRTFQYTMLKKNMFKNRFKNIAHKKVYKNIPPAYVLKCSNIG